MSNTAKIEKRLENPVPIPSWWRSGEADIQEFLSDRIHHGKVVELARSPGGRPVRAVFYGEPELTLRGSANLNSALGARKPEAYWRRAERRGPTVFVLGGMHGHEIEGMMGSLSLLRLMEEGVDLEGTPQPDLLEKLQATRLIVIPLANPDGRARVPYDGWVGLPRPEMTRVGQGTRADGSSYGWPGCKAVHPMQGDVGELGGYFDDAGINLAHDEFFAPMSPVTTALFKLIVAEAPDLLLNLHSYNHPPGVLQLSYVPLQTKRRLADWAMRFYSRMDASGLPHLPNLPEVLPDGDDEKPLPSFNVTSAAWHAGAALPFTFECSHGLDDALAPRNFGYHEILQTHHVLFSLAAETSPASLSPS